MKEYQLGDSWSSDFDYDGMLQKGMEADVSWPIEDLQELYHSFEDVNYHREAGYLWTAIQDLKADSKDNPFLAERGLEDFNNECTKTLTGWNV
tara:strand:- start:1842 stop:2120 length:279 start_codon:yes stop_codon:yes gene_type:complete